MVSDTGSKRPCSNESRVVRLMPCQQPTDFRSATLPLSWVAVVVLCLSASGCGDPQKRRQEALRADPQFAEVLEKRDQLADRITLLRREFAVKKHQVEGQIARLRQELTQARRQMDQKVQQLKAQLRADQERVALALSRAGEELRAKQSQRASLGRSISQLRKVLQDPSHQWTQADRTRMDRELDELLRETKRLDAELGDLDAHVHLLKIKRSLLRL